MKIQIKHISNTYNYGSCMMAVTLIKSLRDSFKDLKIYVDAKTDENINRLIKETGFSNISKDNFGNSSSIFVRVMNRMKVKQVENRVDVIIVIGGDDISEYYGVDYLIGELEKLEKLSNSKKVILLGQTMGPFNDGRDKIAEKKLRKCIIYTRDDKNFDYLKGIGFTNVYKGRDLAFSDLPNQNNGEKILDRYSLLKDEYVTLVPSGLMECYTKDYKNYIKEYEVIIEYLLQNKELQNKKIVLLPHVLIPKNVDDRNIIRELKNKQFTDKERLVFIDDAMLPSEARNILGNGIFTITGRMHAAVSTFYMRKPAISLSYSIKYAGVIGEGLDMDELIIEAADSELWKENKISKKVNEKVQFLLNEYDSLTNKISKNVLGVKTIVENCMDNLNKEINK